MRILKLLLTTGVSIALVGALGALPAAAGTALPDGEVKKPGRPYVGHGVINDTGADQSVSARRSPGEKAVFKFRYENVGSATDDFEIDACITPMAFNARYFRGDRDVTEKLSSGTITIRDVAPGARTPVITAKVKVLPEVIASFTLGACVKASASNPLDRDAPAWLVTVES